MSQAVSFGQITITDLTDIGTLSVYPTANQPLSVIYDPDQNTFTPNWGSSNLVVTPVIYYGGQQLTSSSTGVTITWKRQEGSGAEANLSTGEAVSNGVLTVSANKFTSSSTMLSYIVNVQYVEPDAQVTLNAAGKITFTLVKQASKAKTAQVTGDTIFKYNSSQVIVGAESITLTATVNNVSISAWQYQNSSGTWTTYPNSGTASTLTVNATDSTFVNNKCLIKLVTNDNNVYDLHTITKLYDGPRGDSSLAAILTNEDQVLPASSSGTIISYDGAESEFVIYRGGTVETSNWTITRSNTGTITYKVSMDGTSWSDSDVSGNWTHVKVTAMTSATASITFTANKAGESPLIKTFSIVRVNTGADGVSPTVYSLEPSALAVNKDINDAFTPTSVVVRAYSKTGTNARANYSGRFKIYAGAASGTAIYTSTSDESSHTISSTNLTNAITAGYITAQLYASGGTSTLLDTQTIVITSDGATGGQGPQGNAGVDAINVILGNQADVIPCDPDNNTEAQITIQIPFGGYKGTSRVACSVTNPGQLFGVSPTITAATTSADGKVQYVIPAGTTVSDPSGTLTLTFSCQSKTITMYYRWTRSNSGESAVILQTNTPLGNVFSNGTGNLTIEGILYKGSSLVTSSATWVWKKYASGSYSQTVGTTASVTIAGSTVDSFASYQCTATYNGNSYVSYVSLIDKTDPLQCEVLSSIGDQIINGVGAGAFYVLVYRNGTEVDPIKSTRFLTSPPSSATAGDFYYHVDTTNKTLTLKKYSGSSWGNASSSESTYSGTYNWTHMDKDGNTIAGIATSGKVIYIDGTLFEKKMISTVQVTIS